MGMITSTAQFNSTLPPAQVREKAIDWFKSYSYKIEEDAPGRLTVYSGSQVKMRLIGGAFVAGSTLPTRTTLELTPSGAGTDVKVMAEDSVKVGIKTGMKGKYQKWTEQITAGLRDACSGAAG
jgi:hypothetical protein